MSQLMYISHDLNSLLPPDFDADADVDGVAPFVLVTVEVGSELLLRADPATIQP